MKPFQADRNSNLLTTFAVSETGRVALFINIRASCDIEASMVRKNAIMYQYMKQKQGILI